VEKLYDIASTVPALLKEEDTLQSTTTMTTYRSKYSPDSAQTNQLAEVLHHLSHFVSRYRGGQNEFVGPLEEAVGVVMQRYELLQGV
jgi:hypothetical protein